MKQFFKYLMRGMLLLTIVVNAQLLAGIFLFSDHEYLALIGALAIWGFVLVILPISGFQLIAFILEKLHWVRSNFDLKKEASWLITSLVPVVGIFVVSFFKFYIS